MLPNKRQAPVHLGIPLVVLAGIMLVAGYLQPQETTAQGRAVTLRIQATWPPGSFYDNLELFAQRVEQMSGGRLKIETLPGGAVVPPRQVLDATSRGVIDGAHAAPAYWTGKHRAAIPLSHAPVFGMDYVDFFGWYYEGGGIELLNEWSQAHTNIPAGLPDQ